LEMREKESRQKKHVASNTQWHYGDDASVIFLPAT